MSWQKPPIFSQLPWRNGNSRWEKQKSSILETELRSSWNFFAKSYPPLSSFGSDFKNRCQMMSKRFSRRGARKWHLETQTMASKAQNTGKNERISPLACNLAKTFPTVIYRLGAFQHIPRSYLQDFLIIWGEACLWVKKRMLDFDISQSHH